MPTHKHIMFGYPQDAQINARLLELIQQHDKEPFSLSCYVHRNRLELFTARYRGAGWEVETPNPRKQKRLGNRDGFVITRLLTPKEANIQIGF